MQNATENQSGSLAPQENVVSAPSDGTPNNAQNVVQNVPTQAQNFTQAGVNLVEQVVNPAVDMSQPPVKQEEKIYATIAYVPLMAVLSIIVKPDSAFVRLHSKQGVLLTVMFFLLGFLSIIVSFMGIIGQLLLFLMGIASLGIVLTGIYSMYLTASGYWWKIPVLSAVADLIPIEMIAKVSKENITGQMGEAKNDYDNRQDTLQKESAQNVVQQQAATVAASGANAQQSSVVSDANSGVQTK